MASHFLRRILPLRSFHHHKRTQGQQTPDSLTVTPLGLYDAYDIVFSIELVISSTGSGEKDTLLSPCCDTIVAVGAVEPADIDAFYLRVRP